MGAILPSKMPSKKEIIRKDDPNKVAMYKKGGKVKKLAEGGSYEAEAMPDTADIIRRLNVQGDATSDKGSSQVGGRVGYSQPIDEKTKLELGLSGHYSKGKGFKSAGVDAADLKLQRQLDRDSDLNFSLGAGKRRGINSAEVSYNRRFADGGEVWDKERPKGLGAPQKLSPTKKASAKASAKRAGRPYPNLVDNMRAAKRK